MRARSARKSGTTPIRKRCARRCATCSISSPECEATMLATILTVFAGCFALERLAPGWRLPQVRTLLARRDWHARLLNGSDYPMPGVLPLVSLQRLAAHGFIAREVVAPLAELRNHNVLLFDFVLKRSLGNNGAGFARSVFETRPYFEA